MLARLFYWLLRACLYVMLGGLVGMMFDRGHPAKGLFLDDLPSTLGILLGTLISFVELWYMW